MYWSLVGVAACLSAATGWLATSKSMLLLCRRRRLLLLLLRAPHHRAKRQQANQLSHHQMRWFAMAIGACNPTRQLHLQPMLHLVCDQVRPCPLTSSPPRTAAPLQLVYDYEEVPNSPFSVEDAMALHGLQHFKVRLRVRQCVTRCCWPAAFPQPGSLPQPLLLPAAAVGASVRHKSAGGMGGRHGEACRRCGGAAARAASGQRAGAASACRAGDGAPCRAAALKPLRGAAAAGGHRFPWHGLPLQCGNRLAGKQGAAGAAVLAPSMEKPPVEHAVI